MCCRQARFSTADGRHTLCSPSPVTRASQHDIVVSPNNPQAPYSVLSILYCSTVRTVNKHYSSTRAADYSVKYHYVSMYQVPGTWYLVCCFSRIKHKTHCVKSTINTAVLEATWVYFRIAGTGTPAVPVRFVLSLLEPQSRFGDKLLNF